MLVLLDLNEFEHRRNLLRCQTSMLFGIRLPKYRGDIYYQILSALMNEEKISSIFEALI